MKLHQKHIKRPEWLKIKLDTSREFGNTRELLQNQDLNTVCESAKCPNIYDCWNRKTATIMILGNICTRSCMFCSVNTGKPNPVDLSEPIRVAKAVKEMGLKHIVLTSVDRDDLKDDYGSTIWHKTILKVREINPNCSIEVLTPDFLRKGEVYKSIVDSMPDVFNHNIETVSRLYKTIRPGAIYKESLNLLS